MMRFLISSMFVMALSVSANAGDVTIVDAQATKSGGNEYRFSVTLEHEDKDWHHYADEWRVLLEDGTVLGVRKLHHPHVNEQPFTRSLGGVNVPEGTEKVFIDARDSVHGRSGKLFEISLPE